MRNGRQLLFVATGDFVGQPSKTQVLRYLPGPWAKTVKSFAKSVAANAERR